MEIPIIIINLRDFSRFVSSTNDKWDKRQKITVSIAHEKRSIYSMQIFEHFSIFRSVFVQSRNGFLNVQDSYAHVNNFFLSSFHHCTSFYDKQKNNNLILKKE